VCLPWAVLIKYFPDEWFAIIAAFLSKPVLAIYTWCCQGVTNLKESFKKIKRKNNKGITYFITE